MFTWEIMSWLFKDPVAIMKVIMSWLFKDPGVTVAWLNLNGKEVKNINLSQMKFSLEKR